MTLLLASGSSEGLRIARTPDELFRARDRAVMFLDDLHPLTQPAVPKLGALVRSRIIAGGSPNLAHCS